MNYTIAVLYYLDGTLHFIACSGDKAAAEETFYEWCAAKGITSGDCHWMALS